MSSFKRVAGKWVKVQQGDKHSQRDHFYSASLRGITCGIETDDNFTIVRAAPVLEKFVGQKISNLRDWLVYKGGSLQEITTQVEELHAGLEQMNEENT